MIGSSSGRGSWLITRQPPLMRLREFCPPDLSTFQQNGVDNPPTFPQRGASLPRLSGRHCAKGRTHTPARAVFLRFRPCPPRSLQKFIQRGIFVAQLRVRSSAASRRPKAVHIVLLPRCAARAALFYYNTAAQKCKHILPARLTFSPPKGIIQCLQSEEERTHGGTATKEGRYAARRGPHPRMDPRHGRSQKHAHHAEDDLQRGGGHVHRL